MSGSVNPQRPTPTWKLVLIALAASIFVIPFVAMTGGDDPQVARQNAASFGAWGIRLLLVGALAAGGWSAFTRNRRR
jgi:hypothetical protein